MEFFRNLGFTFNGQFTDENAACMVIGENIYVMLLVEKFFSTFTNKPVSDASKSTEVIVAIDSPGRSDVDEMFNKAIAAGGTKYREPQDHGWMYIQSFADPDGHLWEIIYMDESAIPKTTSNTN
jgi:predicted lactoylglutathione lyase